MTLSVGSLIQALQDLCTQEDNALPEFPVVVRVDLGPEQEFRIVGVSLEEPDEFGIHRDPYVVIEGGCALLGDDPWSAVDAEEQPPAKEERDR